MLKNVMTIENSVVKADGIISSDMDGEKVLLSIKNSRYYNLGHVGGAIWELLDKPMSFSEIVNNLVSEYDVSYLECEKQVNDFLEQMLQESLIVIHKPLPLQD